MAVGFPEGPSYPGDSLTQSIFSPFCPLNDQRKAARSFFKIDRLSSLFSNLSLARLLILLLLLMSGNVHSNPGPIFSFSVCAGNVAWRGRSVQCCTCSKWVHLKCSQLSSSRFRTLGSPHSWSCPLCCFFPSRDSTSISTVTSSSYSSSRYTLTAQSGPSANAAIQPHPHLQTSYPFSAHFVSYPSAPSPSPHTPGCFSLPPVSFSPP